MSLAPAVSLNDEGHGFVLNLKAKIEEKEGVACSVVPIMEKENATGSVSTSSFDS